MPESATLNPPIGTQVLDELGIGGDLILTHAQLLGNNGFNFGQNLFFVHIVFLLGK